MAHTCRGTINLANAIIHKEDSTTIVISNGGAQTFHLKAGSEVERQKWIMALEMAKTEAMKLGRDGRIPSHSHCHIYTLVSSFKTKLSIYIASLDLR